MSTDGGNEGWATPGVIASAVVLVTVLLAGVWVVASRDDRRGGESTAPTVTSTVPAAQPGASTTPASGPTTAPPREDLGCSGLPASTDLAPPEGTRWIVHPTGVQVPSADDLGPVKEDNGTCFARSPAGAVASAIWLMAEGRRPGNDRQLILERFVPNKGRVLGLAAAEQNPTGSPSPVVCTPEGYRIISASADQVVLQLAVRCQGTFAVSEMTMQWFEGDWRVALNDEGLVGPRFETDSMIGFTTWKAGTP